MKTLQDILKEAIGYDYYKFSDSFSSETIEVEDEDTGETYSKDVLSPVQIIRFKTDNNIPYLWYARQSRYDETAWEIAFGVESSVKAFNGASQLNINKTGTGDAFKIFSTVVAITNTFIEFDENLEVHRLIMESEGHNRTQLYLKRILPKIEKFKVDSVSQNGETSTIIMTRTEFW